MFAQDGKSAVLHSFRKERMRQARACVDIVRDSPVCDCYHCNAITLENLEGSGAASVSCEQDVLNQDVRVVPTDVEGVLSRSVL